MISRLRFLLLAVVLTTGSGCFYPHRHADDNELCEIHFIDVGYGDAILVKLGPATFFVDGGYSPMTSVVLDYLQKVGVRRLDALMVTHPHPDHIGGAYGILDSGFRVGSVYCPYDLNDPEMPEGFVELVKNKIASGELVFNKVSEGDCVMLPGNRKLYVASPKTLNPDLNESSMVIHFYGIGKGVLLTGDIGIQAQERLIRSHPDIFPVTVLKAPHHGGSALEEFYRLTNPTVTVISDGVNPYGNPKKETLDMLKRWSEKVIRLSQSGAVVVIGTPGGKVKIVKTGI